LFSTEQLLWQLLLVVKFNRKVAFRIIVISGLLTLSVIYYIFDPLGSPYFPRCPFLVLTGLQCPGCGSQRAIHHLLNFELIAAVKANALVVLFLPYILLGVVFRNIKHYSPRLLRMRKMLFGFRAIIIVLITVLGFWAWRLLG